MKFILFGRLFEHLKHLTIVLYSRQIPLQCALKNSTFHCDTPYRILRYLFSIFQFRKIHNLELISGEFFIRNDTRYLFLFQILDMKFTSACSAWVEVFRCQHAKYKSLLKIQYNQQLKCIKKKLKNYGRIHRISNQELGIT